MSDFRDFKGFFSWPVDIRETKNDLILGLAEIASSLKKTGFPEDEILRDLKVSLMSVDAVARLSKYTELSVLNEGNLEKLWKEVTLRCNNKAVWHVVSLCRYNYIKYLLERYLNENEFDKEEVNQLSEKLRIFIYGK